jgi:glutathione S-transferase
MPRIFNGTPDEEAIAAALPRARLCLSEIDRLMEDHRFLTGAHVSLADLMLIPLLYYFGNVPDGRTPMAEHPKLQNWVKQMEARQSFQVTKPLPF